MEIELYSKLNNPVEAISRIGEIFSKSGMFGCNKVEQGQVLAMICLSERKSPVQVLKTYHIVDGNLSKKALAALAEFRQGGGKHKWLKSGDEPGATEDARYAELELTDKEGNKTVYRYSMADAKAEGLIKPGSRWTKRPGNMLRARCISNGVGMLCPEIFAGEDGDSDAPQVESAPLLQKQPEQKQETANVVDVPAEVVTQPAVTQATEVHPPDLSAASRAYTVADIQVSEETGRLTVDAMGAIESVYGDALPKLIKWANGIGWLKPGEGISCLKLQRAKNIFEKHDEVLKKLENIVL